MLRADGPHIGYVVKRYPRFSETFIVTEILAHEAAGVSIDVFSLYPPVDTHFQDAIARVRAPVTYLTAEGVKAADLWTALEKARDELPEFWRVLGDEGGASADVVYRASLLAREVRRRGITHLHAHFATIAATVTRLAARLAGVSYSVTAHAKDIYHETVGHDHLARVLGDAAAVLTVSDFNRAFLCRALGVPSSRVRRVYNGLDLTRLPFATATGRAPVVLAVGRLVEKKGFGDLLEACAMLASGGVAFECVIVGQGPLEGTLRADVTRLGLAKRVTLLGPRAQPEVFARIQSAAVFVAPCVIGDDGDRDGLPTVLLEAMALGTPCIATDVTGVPEILRHERTGLLVEQRSPQAIAAAIERLLRDPELGRVFALAARGLIEREFDANRNAARLQRIFRKASRAAAPKPDTGFARERAREARHAFAGRLP